MIDSSLPYPSMKTPPFIEINDAGISFLADRPIKPTHPADKPVQVSIHRDLSIKIEGDGFSVATQLSDDQAFGLVSMLIFTLRDKQFK